MVVVFKIYKLSTIMNEERVTFIFKFLLASERSERDTYRGNTIENRGCLFIYLFIYLYICMDVCMSFCTLTLAFLC